MSVTTRPPAVSDALIAFHDAVERAVEAHDFGKATAAKRGRNPEYPYVPIIVRPGGVRAGATHQEQIRGAAYRTRVEAVETASQLLAAERRSLIARLTDPRHRALRESHGLPREIPATIASRHGPNRVCDGQPIGRPCVECGVGLCACEHAYGHDCEV